MPQHPGKNKNREKVDASSNDSPPSGFQNTQSVTERFSPDRSEMESRTERPFGAFSPATFED